MFISINLPAGTILFPVQLSLLAFCKVTIVRGHIRFFLIFDMVLSVFQVSGLAGRKRTVLHAVGDAILLVGFAAIHFIDARMARINLSRSRAGCVLGLSSGGSNKHQTTHCQD